MIDRVMQPARFLAADRATHDQLGHCDQVAQLDQIRIEQMVPIVAMDLFFQQMNTTQCAFEPPVAADNADVIPHQAPDLIPAMGYEYALLGTSCAARVPFWKRRWERCLVQVLHRSEGPTPPHCRFPERIRSEPIRAVETGHR